MIEEEVKFNFLAQSFADYFKEEHSKVVKKYAYKAYERLKEGHIVSYVEEDDLGDLLVSKYVSVDEKNLSKPFVLIDNRFYMQRYFFYESIIVNRITDLLQSSKDVLEERRAFLLKSKDFVQELFEGFKPEEGELAVNWQKVAALNSVLHNFSIITGGPGTGKTTTVAKLLAVLYEENPHLKVALAAQTGKAAARLKESLRKSKDKLSINEFVKGLFDEVVPSTIHRLLQSAPRSIDFKHNHANPLPHDVLIIDESSMIDVPLMAKLFDAVGENTRVILLGDKNQLASVEAGSVFGDLCDTTAGEINLFPKAQNSFFNELINEGKVPESYDSDSVSLIASSITELKKSYRFNGLEGIGRFSQQVIQGDLINFEEYQAEPKKEGVFIRESIKDDSFESYLDLYRSYLSNKDPLTVLNKFNDVRVLCAVHRGAEGLESLNQRIETYLAGKGLIKPTALFYPYRPILITKNDYTLGLFNGDIGICLPDESGEVKVYFEDSEQEKGFKAIVPDYIQAHETVFAMTIHKSQGSEFEHVVVVLPKGDVAIVTRELLYTGVTRAKKTVLLIGEEEVVKEAIVRKVERVSGITQRF